MSVLLVSVEHSGYVLAARLAHADLGPVPSRIYFYATPWTKIVGADPGAPALVECILARPAGTVVAIDVLTPTGMVVVPTIVLAQAEPGGDLITIGGVAVWARWVSGNGDIVAEGDVSDESGIGAFKVAGTAGTTLYAGGRFFLPTSALS